MQGRRQVVKAPGFDPGIRRFESCRPCHFQRHQRSHDGKTPPPARLDRGRDIHRNGQSAAEQR